MNFQIRKDLARAGNLIATEKQNSICYAIDDRSYNSWLLTEEVKMIKPENVTQFDYWWDSSTGIADIEERGARLIGIAMMITMPVEIINHQCVVNLLKRRNLNKYGYKISRDIT